MSVDEPPTNHERPAMICSNEESNPPQALPCVSEAGYNQVKIETGGTKSEPHPEEAQDSGQGPMEWPSQVEKVYVSYFEREEVEVDNNDK